MIHDIHVIGCVQLERAATPHIILGSPRIMVEMKTIYMRT
jgi:hypothetical protein